MTTREFIEVFDTIAEAPGGIDRLRELVLQLAVRGRLVPQDSDDEPAAVLLEQIAQESADLVKKKKIRASKPLSPVSQQEVNFEIPQSWMWIRLGSLCHLEMGQSPSSLFYNQTGEGLPFYQGKADFGDRFPTVRYWCTKPTKLADMGDILLSVRAPIGPTNIATELCCIGRGLAALRPLAGLPTEYLLWTLRAFEEQLDDMGTGTTFKAISRKLLEPFPLPLPPLAEQHRIVAKVDQLMGLIDQLEAAQHSRETVRTAGRNAALAELRNAATPAKVETAWTCIAERMDDLFTTPDDLAPLREAALQLAMRGRLVPQDTGEEPAAVLLERIADKKSLLLKEGKLRTPKPLPPIATEETPFDVPDQWEWVRLGDIVNSRLGKMLDKSKNKGPYRRYLRNANVQWFRFDLSDVLELRLENAELEEYSVKENDLIVCEGGEPGRAAVCGLDVDGMVFQKALHRVRPWCGISTWYLAYLLRCDTWSQRINILFTGATIKHLTGKALATYMVPLPPLSEQYRIVAKVEELMRLIDRLEQHLYDKEEIQGDFAGAICSFA